MTEKLTRTEAEQLLTTQSKKNKSERKCIWKVKLQIHKELKTKESKLKGQ